MNGNVVPSCDLVKLQSEYAEYWGQLKQQIEELMDKHGLRSLSGCRQKS